MFFYQIIKIQNILDFTHIFYTIIQISLSHPAVKASYTIEWTMFSLIVLHGLSIKSVRTLPVNWKLQNSLLCLTGDYWFSKMCTGKASYSINPRMWNLATAPTRSGIIHVTLRRNDGFSHSFHNFSRSNAFGENFIITRFIFHKIFFRISILLSWKTSRMFSNLYWKKLRKTIFGRVWLFWGERSVSLGCIYILLTLKNKKNFHSPTLMFWGYVIEWYFSQFLQKTKKRSFWPGFWFFAFLWN